MPGADTKVKIKMQTVSAVVKHADGRVTDLGVVAGYHRNPLVRLWWRVKYRRKP